MITCFVPFSLSLPPPQPSYRSQSFPQGFFHRIRRNEGCFVYFGLFFFRLRFFFCGYLVNSFRYVAQAVLLSFIYTTQSKTRRVEVGRKDAPVVYPFLPLYPHLDIEYSGCRSERWGWIELLTPGTHHIVRPLLPFLFDSLHPTSRKPEQRRECQNRVALKTPFGTKQNTWATFFSSGTRSVIKVKEFDDLAIKFD